MSNQNRGRELMWAFEVRQFSTMEARDRGIPGLNRGLHPSHTHYLDGSRGSSRYTGNRRQEDGAE